MLKQEPLDETIFISMRIKGFTCSLHIFDMHLDLYWLIGDLDGQPLFKDGREPEEFWRKKLDKPEYQLKRVDYA